MATQTGFANLKVVGPINIPNNSVTGIYTMVRSGLVFASVVSDFNQDVRPRSSFIYWRNNGIVETGEFLNFIIWGNTYVAGDNDPVDNYFQSGNFVPAGATIYQNRLRQGGNDVEVYLYILEFDTAVANFGSA